MASSHPWVRAIRRAGRSRPCWGPLSLYPQAEKMHDLPLSIYPRSEKMHDRPCRSTLWPIRPLSLYPLADSDRRNARSALVVLPFGNFCSPRPSRVSLSSYPCAISTLSSVPFWPFSNFDVCCPPWVSPVGARFPRNRLVFRDQMFDSRGFSEPLLGFQRVFNAPSRIPEGFQNPFWDPI